MNGPPDPAVDQAHVAFADDLWGAIRRLRRHLRRRTRAYSLQLTPAQIEVLQVIQETPDVGVTEIAGALGLAVSTVSTLAKELWTMGLLERSADEHDRRARPLHLAPDATKAIEAAGNVRTEAIAIAYAALSAADRRALHAAIEPLRHLTDHLHPD